MADPPLSMTPRNDEVMLDQVRQQVAARGWIIIQEEHLVLSHTLGLTVYGLPELVVGQTGDTPAQQLDRWATRTAAGELLLGAKVTVHDLGLREHTYLLRGYDASTRGGLWLARALYGQRLTVREIDLRSCPCLPCRAEV